MALKFFALKICTLAALTLPQLACSSNYPESPEPVLLSNADTQFKHWNGIGKIFVDDAGYCTASLLDTRGATNTTRGPAYILTNGHCASIISGSAANTAYKGQMQFNYFHDTLVDGKRYEINKVNWASLASTDVAIMELHTSLDTLLKDGITPLKLASAAPTRPGRVHVIGAPEIAPGLRLSSCTQEPAKTTLVKYLTVHTNYQKQDCKGIAPGSSGSPVLDAASGEITGVLSGTTYGISPDDLCFWHALCADTKTKSLLPDQASHSFPVDYLSYCFSGGRFDMDAAFCTLKPNFYYSSSKDTDVQLYKKPINSSDPTPVWDIDFTMSTPFYRSKTVRDAQACYSSERFSGTKSTADGKVDEPIGRETGLYYLCLLGVESANQRPSTGLQRNTQIYPARIVEPAVDKLPEPTFITEPLDDLILITFREKQDRSIWTQFYAGPIGETNCADIDPKSYEKVENAIAMFLDDLPRTMCSFTMDRNLSTSGVRTDVIQRP
ncbi:MULTISPECIES: serine protease [unclassified Pseudomonas]|uniref:trypsin-like serine peptidase n=1 Tax=unclassified Pseudomonas TaxID=196821 RepID=UPI002AC98BAF|nr:MULTISPECIES: serine protease [unclassified Pseudomonas]MEB0044714.1 serine protease [Pseudomonas sp. Dout3]MEB0096319.1 serine protease [Pseudomonas sp. DC1.2]WPX59284.1 serine protease [Pseudomonas sp. DC1.2]